MTNLKHSLLLILATLFLLGSSFSSFIRAEVAFNPETNEGYFIAPYKESYDGETSYGEPILLSLFEDGHLRYLLALADRSGEYYNSVKLKDFFSGEIVFKTRILPDEQYEFEDPYWVNEKYFREGTVIKTLCGDPYLWMDKDYRFWAENPGRSPKNYDDLRAYYETAFSPDERFPRRQIVPADHPASRIPRDRDHLSLTLFPNIAQLTLRFEDGGEIRLFAEVRSQEEMKEKRLTRTTEYYELFTGTWLHTKTAVDNANKKSNRDTKNSYQVNEEYLRTQFSGRKIVQGEDFSEKGYKTYYYYETMFFIDGHVLNSVDDGRYDNLFRESKTIGDLRRVYEMLPRQEWFIRAVYETPIVPDYDPPGKTFRPVFDAFTLRDALSKAKNGDTIVVLCDIRWDLPFYNIENKKITIKGLEGQHPCILCEKDKNWTDTGSWLFSMTKSNVSMENVRIETNNRYNCIALDNKSTLTLGYGTEVMGFEDVVNAHNGSKFILDGGYIHHNTGSVFSEYGYCKMHLISGEIAYNHNSGWDIISTSDFIMDGGSIHDNSVGDRSSVLYIYGKGEINEGEIHDNYGFSILKCYNSLKITGGEISDNNGVLTGGIDLNCGNWAWPKRKTSILMTGGSVHNNMLIRNSEFALINTASNLVVNSTHDDDEHGASFDMSGGSIYQTLPQDDIPSIVVYGSKGSLTLSKDALVDVSSIVLREGGKLQNKLKGK